MRRGVLVIVVACAALLASAGAAVAHPLGNFTINHISRVAISEDAVDVGYVLDIAEIPTFQERRLTDEQSLARKTASTLAGLELTVDGRRAELAPTGPGRLEKVPGQGGLQTTRFELDLRAAVSDPRKVRLSDSGYAGRIGWRAIVVEPGRGTAVRTTEAFSSDPTDGLRRYPTALLQTPLDQRVADFTVRSGDGSVAAPPGPGAGQTRNVSTARSGDGFADVFSNAAAGQGVLVFFLLAAFAWGAFHALSPGHGKVMVAAYLVGTKGTTRDAVALGAIVTVTHTIGVFALGLVTLALSQYILPEDLYPYLNLTAGLLVVVLGLQALASRARDGHGHGHAHDHGNLPAHGTAHDHEDAHAHGHGHGSALAHRSGHQHDHDHDHDHEHDQEHDHDHDHQHDHEHDHAKSGRGRFGRRKPARGHSHLPPERLTPRGLLGMGAAAGLIPCPSALVVLLGAIAQHQIALGLLLITVFSLGLAGTLTAVGLLIVHSRARMPTGRGGGLVMRALPVVSALLILAVGSLLTIRAIPTLS